MDCLISFIIPAFNASETIIRCLESVFSLPLAEAEYEVIVIDDHSSDNTVDIVSDCMNRHPNLLLLCQTENHRQGAARNRGLSIAKGKFIAFIDSDDEADKGIFPALQLGIQNRLDMVAMRVEKRSIDKQNISYFDLPFESTSFFSGVELQTLHPFWFTGPCAYLYSSDFLASVAYPFEGDVLFEDSDFVNVHLYKAGRMAYCKDCGYIIHENPSSTTHTISYKNVCDYALLGTRLLNLYQGIDVKDTPFAESILEGGSYNIMRSFRNVFRLRDMKEVRQFYDRLDSRYDRSRLLGYRTPSYCWNAWTRFCLRHRVVATLIIACIIRIKSIFR